MAAQMTWSGAIRSCCSSCDGRYGHEIRYGLDLASLYD